MAHIIDDIQNVVNLLHHVGSSLSDPANHATWSCISFCNTSSTHSEAHHFKNFFIKLEKGFDKVFLTSFSVAFTVGLVHGMIHSTKSLANSINVFTHATHVDNRLT
jgi:hypothetical protein